ncbi:MAG: RidA family protein [Rhodospirillaceae bacterium]|nr:RidA family protein [Rhodospirillaceae bacterium]
MKQLAIAALFGFVALSCAYPVEAQVEKRAIVNPDLSPASQLSRAILVKGGQTLYIGGQVASTGMKAWTPGDPKPTDDSAVVGRGDFTKQAEHVFKRIETLLTHAGGTYDDVVKMTMYLPDMKNYPTLRGIRNRYMTGPVPAVMTVVGVKELSHPDFMLEIEVIAVIPEKQSR